MGGVCRFDTLAHFRLHVLELGFHVLRSLAFFDAMESCYVLLYTRNNHVCT